MNNLSEAAVSLIFLDIEGVLTTERSVIGRPHVEDQGDPLAVSALNAITNETGARLVLSSSLRCDGVDHWRQTLRKWGVTGELIGTTPYVILPGSDSYFETPRGAEIEAYFSSEGMPAAFVILDDDTDFGELIDKLVHTQMEDGLTLAHAELAIQVLRAN